MMLSKGSLVEPSHKKRRSDSPQKDSGTGKPTSNGQLHKVLWKIGEYNYSPILGSANTSLMEVHMATGKPHDKNNEEEELVDTNLTNQNSQLSKETIRPLLQCVL